MIQATGAAFLLAAWLFYRSVRRARQRGWIGSRRRPVVRDSRPVRFHIAVAFELFGSVVCLVAAYLCLTHSVSVFGH